MHNVSLPDFDAAYYKYDMSMPELPDGKFDLDQLLNNLAEPFAIFSGLLCYVGELNFKEAEPLALFITGLQYCYQMHIWQNCLVVEVRGIGLDAKLLSTSISVTGLQVQDVLERVAFDYNMYTTYAARQLDNAA